MSPEEILRSTSSILVLDWPSRDVPESLARAGFHVTVRGGPGPEDYSSYERNGAQIVVRRAGRAPKHADLIYAYRPLGELPEIIATAKTIGAKAIWTQSGRSAEGLHDTKGCWRPNEEIQKVRELVEAAGLEHIFEPYIGDVARQLQRARQ